MNTTLLYQSGVNILLSSLTFAADKPASPVMVGPFKTRVMKTSKIHDTGKVMKISDKAIKIECEVKGYIAIMALALDKSATKIRINDFIKVDYMQKDGILSIKKSIQWDASRRAISVSGENGVFIAANGVLLHVVVPEKKNNP